MEVGKGGSLYRSKLKTRESCERQATKVERICNRSVLQPRSNDSPSLSIALLQTLALVVLFWRRAAIDATAPHLRLG